MANGLEGSADVGFGLMPDAPDAAAGPAFPTAPNAAPHAVFERADRSLVAIGIVATAIILFVGTGSTVLTGILRSQFYGAGSPNVLLCRAEEAAKRLADTDCLNRPSLDAAMAELMRGAEAS